MNKLIFLSILLAIVAPFVAAQSSWAMIDNDYTTIALSCSFYGDTDGYVAGGTSAVQSELLYTTDGGVTFDNQPLTGGNNQLAAFLSIDMYDENTGVAGGFGFVGIQSGAVKTNGGNWTSIGSELICAYSDARAIDTQTFALIGIWSDSGDYTGNGVRFSTDGGSTWTENNWVARGDPSSPRYGFWLDSDNGYVAGGTFPTTDSADPIDRLLQLNEYVKKTATGYEVDFTRRESRIEGYSGLIQSATSGSTQFTPVYNSTGEGIYFNEMWCSSTSECWVIATGVNTTNGLPASWIMYTDDSFSTLQTQFYGENMSLNTIDMSDASTGWVGGANLSSPEKDGASFYAAMLQTTDGKTWTLNESGSLANFFCYDISAVSASYAYCSGLSALGLSSFASYSPNN